MQVDIDTLIMTQAIQLESFLDPRFDVIGAIGESSPPHLGDPFHAMPNRCLCRLPRRIWYQRRRLLCEELDLVAHVSSRGELLQMCALVIN